MAPHFLKCNHARYRLAVFCGKLGTTQSRKAFYFFQHNSFQFDTSARTGDNMIAMSIISYPSALEPELHSAIVADASSLIIIAKLEAIDTLYQVCGTIGIPPAVFRETVQVGFERRKSDAFTIDVAIRSGHVVVVKLSSAHVAFAQHLYMANTLGWGECETLAFARDTNVQALIEERKGRSIARAEGIRYTTLQVFPLQGFIQHKISYDICVNLLDRIAVMMNTDLSILHALQSAAETIWHERKGGK